MLGNSGESANEGCCQNPLYQTVILRRSRECNEADNQVVSLKRLKQLPGSLFVLLGYWNVMPVISNMPSRDKEAISFLHW